MPLHDRTMRTPLGELRISQSSGRGLPVLMIHGSGAARGVFARQFESPLAETHRLIAFDLPGHGESADARSPETGYTVRGLAEAARWVLDGLGIKRAVVLGWSLGGHIAIELASHHRAVAGLMLVGAPPIAPGLLAAMRGFHTSWDMFLASKKTFSAHDAERFERLCFGDSAIPEFRRNILRADGQLRSIAIRSLVAGDGADQKRTVERAPFPVAIVNGSEDPFVRLGYFDRLDYAHLWEHCHVIEGAGHAPFWEASARFNPLLDRFVADCEQFDLTRTETVAIRRAG
jgi:pimeloyl-ACP methyl ester carboxylesterase